MVQPLADRTLSPSPTMPSGRAPDALADVSAPAAWTSFESAFSRHVRDLVAGGARLLVNLSDDSWFGDGAEPEEHLAHAVFRAIESRRDLIRVAGSGISAHVTATGQVERSLAVSHSDGSVAVLIAEPRLLQAHGLNHWLGEGFPLACAVLIVAALVVSRRRRGRPGPVDSPPIPRHDPARG